ncbi:MAG: polysaccharide lyase family 7 protein [Bacteroidota bacterium]
MINNLFSDQKRPFTLLLLALLFTVSSCEDEVLEDVTNGEAGPAETASVTPASGGIYDWMKNSNGNNNAHRFKLQAGESYSRAGELEIDRATGAFSGDRLHEVDRTNRVRVVGSSTKRLRFEVQLRDEPPTSNGRPRSEMREMTRESNNKDRVAYWDTDDARTFEFEAQIIQLDANCESVAIMQWFGNDDDIMKIIARRVSSSEVEIVADIEGTQNDDGRSGNKFIVLGTADVNSGDYFKCKIRVGDGGDRVNYIDFNNGSGNSTRITHNSLTNRSLNNNQRYDLDVSNSGKTRVDDSYFKYGTYLHSSSGSELTRPGKAVVDFRQVKMNNSHPY